MHKSQKLKAVIKAKKAAKARKNEKGFDGVMFGLKCAEDKEAFVKDVWKTQSPKQQGEFLKQALKAYPLRLTFLDLPSCEALNAFTLAQ